MCEHLLYDTLEGKVQVNTLLKWLINRNSEDDSFKDITGSGCFQSDFISFFLNYIHYIQTSNDKNGETPLKASTPKRLEHLKDCHDNDVSATPTIKRRSLFNESDSNKFTECTPKVIRNNLDESYASPLSPLYNRQNFTTPKDKNPVHSSSKTTPNLCLGDFITYNNKSSSKKKAQKNLNENVYLNCEENSGGSVKARRINPTSLTQRKCNSVNFRKSGNSFTFRNGADEVVDNCDGQRSFLVEERMKIISRKNSGDNLPKLAVSKTLIMNRKNEVVPLFELVTFKQQLQVFVLIYSFLLDHSFVLNLTSELFFLVSTLLSKEYEEDASPNNSFSLGVKPLADELTYQNPNLNKTLFKTIHNRVYFASKVLEKQVNVLKILDRSILRLLIENRRLQQFSHPKFLEHLVQIHEHKADRLSEIAEQGIQTNVCFISDTDNRDNFPSDPSFHAFRKQRDLFYEALRIWENNHLQNEWNFVVALGGKIKALLNMHADPANLVHFVRLFKAQLLMNTSGKSATDDDTIGENQLSFLSSIPNINAEKLSRLKSRIVSKQTCSGINSVPVFTGYQEFYRDFLLIASNPAFNRHLNDALITEIIELNDTKLNSSDLDDINSGIDSTTRKSYLLCIKSLRILAKFLGFLESLPYKSECVQLPENVVSSQISIRNKIQPSMNLKEILRNAVINKNLILTIPWITKYLAMLDYVTLRLPYYEDVCHILFELYYFHANYSEINGKSYKMTQSYNCMTLENLLLVKLCLGWLFELPHFPEGKYYIWISQNFNLCTENMNLLKSPSKSSFLDELDVVDQNILHVCCPYLQEIKAILSNDANSSNNANVTIKHITPVTAIESPTDLSSKRIQLQLEEAFFNGQPVSIRKTVEFISERVASACVKEICNETVPEYKKAAVIELREMLNLHVPLDMTVDESTTFMLVNTKTSEFATSCLQSLKLQIDNKLKTIMSLRISASVEALLATDVLKQTKDVCVTIATRMCMDRVQQWINSHVNSGIFTKDFDGEVRKLLASSTNKNVKPKPVFSLPTFGKSVEHNSSTLSGVKVVENIRSLSWIFMDKPGYLRRDMVTDLLDSVYQSITQRCDLNECILSLINKTLVDMVLLLIAHRPDVMLDDTNITQKLCLIWKGCGISLDDLFKTLVCPRNLMLLMQSVSVEMTWKCFRKFINILLSEKLLVCDILETEVVAVFKQISDKVILKLLFDCLRGVIEDYNKTSEDQSNLVPLLCFLTKNDLTVV